MLCDSLEGRDEGVGVNFRGEGTHVYLIHIVVWQEPAQYCKAIILQLKNFKTGTRNTVIYGK